VIRISFVMPSRGRPGPLRRTINTMFANAVAPESWELFVITDDDDQSSVGATLDLHSHYSGANLRFLTRPRSANLSNDYYNWVFFGHAPLSPAGDVFGVIGDDVDFVTPAWDAAAIAALDELLTRWPDRVFAAYPQDLNGVKPDVGLPSWGWFPLMTRKTAGLLGWFIPAEFPTWAADVLIARLFSAVGRYARLPYTLDHVSYHNYANVPQDETAISMRNRFHSREEGAIRAAFMAHAYPGCEKILREAINA